MIKYRKPKRIFIIGIITFFLLILSLFIYVIVPRGIAVSLSPIEFALFSEVIQDGDIICRLGDRFWSQQFRDISTVDNRFSHMGIVRITNGVITVIHTEGNSGHGIDYVNEIPIETFIEIARAIGIYRLNDIEGSLISSLAPEYLGIPFDWQMDMSDDSRLYCTELLYVILKRIAPEIVLHTIYIDRLGKNVIPLEAVSNSELFTEVFFISSR